MRGKEILQALAALYVVRVIELGLMAYATVTLGRQAYSWANSTPQPDFYKIPFVIGMLFMPKELYDQYNSHERRLREAALERRRRANESKAPALRAPFDIGDFIVSLKGGKRRGVDILRSLPPAQAVTQDPPKLENASVELPIVAIDAKLDKSQSPASKLDTLQQQVLDQLEEKQEEEQRVAPPPPPPVQTVTTKDQELKKTPKHSRSGCKPFCGT